MKGLEYHYNINKLIYIANKNNNFKNKKSMDISNKEELEDAISVC